MKDLEFLPGTLYENLSLNTQNVSKAELNQLFKKLNVLKEVESLPEGLNSQILLHKGDLAQSALYKLSIIRAVLAKPLLLILDEVIDHISQNDIDLLLAFLKTLTPKPTIILTSRNQVLSQTANKVISL